MERKVYGYIRVSTTMQSEDGVSLQNQRERVEGWAKANGLTVAEVFTDAGISGKRADNRPALLEALDAVSKAKGILVVYSLSRMSRSVKDAITISERLDKAGADLVSLSERLDTSTASGKMTFRMMAVLAEFERDQLSERVASAMGHLKAQGKRVGKVPFGWDLLADGETLEPNAQEQAVISSIVGLHAEGQSLRTIAATLNGKGVAAKTGSHWHPETIRGILKRSALQVAA
jgi:DNA invertase Pin-like site-specific DNA recombinase